MFKEYDFNKDGQRVSIWSGGSNNLQGQYYWRGTPVAFYAGGSTHFQHQDWVGTERMRTTYNGSIEGMFTQGPFGENYTVTQGTDSDDAHFAGQDADSATQTSHAQFRELASTYGRWMSPDLYDGSYNMWDPQSLNRYSYVLNNPFGLRDPTGLYEEICSTYYYDVDGEGGGEQTECFILDDGGGGGWGGGAVRGGGGARAPTNNQPQPKQPTLLQQANKPNGYCSRMEILGAGATVVGGGMFLTGTALDGTFVGAVVGVPLQVSGGIGMALGGVVSGVGFLGKAVGVCQ